MSFVQSRLGERARRTSGGVIGPYTEADWERDRAAVKAGEALACPDCGHTENYVLAEGRRWDGSPRRYRGCKVCGFWQEADGESSPYRCRLTVHICLARFAEERECRGCGNGIGPALWHLCLRILRPDEEWRCPECGTALETQHTVPWPASGGEGDA